MLAALIFAHLAFSGPLEDLDRYLGKSLLAKEFKLNQEVVILNQSCLTKNSCDDFKTKTKVTATTSDYVELTDLKMSGEAISINKLTQDLWEQNHGNFVRFLIASKNSYGYKMNIETASLAQATVVVDGAKKVIHGYRVFLSGTNGSQTISEEMFVTNELPGLGQVLEHEWTNSLFSGGREKRTLQIFNSH